MLGGNCRSLPVRVKDLVSGRGRSLSLVPLYIFGRLHVRSDGTCLRAVGGMEGPDNPGGRNSISSALRHPHRLH